MDFGRTSTGQDGADHAVIAPDSTVSTSEITRRRFGKWTAKLVLGTTAIFGGLVGFAPTDAFAVSCLPGTKQNFPFCTIGCVGPCLCSGNSCCNNGIQNVCCNCTDACGECAQAPFARVVQVCSVNGYFCCVAC